MAAKKPDRKNTPQTRPSLVSKSLGAAAKNATAPSRDEPWRNKGKKGK